MSFRIGLGTDFHQFEEGRPLFLGGVEIEHYKGLAGHSDADVLLHAICDALLGALALGDIGVHFPNTDDKYKNIDSKILLTKCFELIQQKNYKVVNIDCMLCLEEPKIKPHIPLMQKVISGILKINSDDISIKATTTEKLGAIGRGEGAMAQAVVLLEKII